MGGHQGIVTGGACSVMIGNDAAGYELYSLGRTGLCRSLRSVWGTVGQIFGYSRSLSAFHGRSDEGPRLDALTDWKTSALPIIIVRFLSVPKDEATGGPGPQCARRAA